MTFTPKSPTQISEDPLFVSTGSAVRKYTMTGTFVNSTTIDITPTQFGFAVVNETVWVCPNGSGTALYYGYACSRFTGGSISYDASWNMGSVGNSTPMNIAFDGTYYYMVSGGYSSNPFMRFNRDRSLSSSGTYGGDGRSVMCRGPMNNKALVAGCYSVGSYIKRLADTLALYGGGYFSAYDTINAYYRDAPTAASLYAAGYRAILAFSDYSWYNSTNWGNTLADFVELGGGVVVTVFADQNTIHLQGRWNPRYTLWDVNSNGYTSGALGTVYLPGHPIMTGVSAVTCDNYRTAAATPKTSTYNARIADWTSGNLECVAYDSTGKRAAYLGFYPMFMVGALGGQWITQVNNALKWAGGWTPAVHDVGCKSLLAPLGSIVSGTSVTPACSVYNYGTVTEASYTVRLKIATPTPINVTATVTAHAPGTPQYVTFAPWTANPVGGPYAVTCSTELTTDVVPANNKQTGSVTVTAAAVHDVGCTKLAAPSGTIDSGTVVTPACSVYNYSTGYTETFQVRMQIGLLYDMVVAVTGLPPLTRALVSFPAWTASPRCTSAVKCSTWLSGDAVPANDKQTGFVDVNVNDVGCTKIIVPAGTIPPGNYTPACSVHSWSKYPITTYTVTMTIGSSTGSATVTNHLPGTRQYVTFPTWAATPGTYATKCSTELTTDLVRANDKATGSVTVQAPLRVWVDSTWDWQSFVGDTTYITFHVKNIYTGVDSFRCVPRTDAFAWPVSPAWIVHLSPGQDTLVNIWAICPTGTPIGFAQRVWLGATSISEPTQGDSAYAYVYVVPRRSVAVNTILAPVDSVRTGDVIVPRAIVRNTGDSTETFPVTFTITPPDSGPAGAGPCTTYVDVDDFGRWQTTAVDSGMLMAGGARVDTGPMDVWDGWITVWGRALPVPPGWKVNLMRCRAMCWGPPRPMWLEQRLTGCWWCSNFRIQVFAGPQHLRHPIIVVLNVKLCRPGWPSRWVVYIFRIWRHLDQKDGPVAVNPLAPVYVNTRTITLAPGAVDTVAFDPWTAATTGDYQAITLADLQLDTHNFDVPAANRQDDELPIAFYVRPAQPADTGWVRKADLPLGPKSKRVKDGGCLAYAPDSTGDYIYAFKGNNRCEFYRYNTASNTWDAKESIPAIGRLGKKKAVKKGAAMAGRDNVRLNDSLIYAAKGNNCLEFWQYNPNATDAYPWSQKTDVPTGAKNVKEGAGMVPIRLNDSLLVYLLKGSGTQEFYRYNSIDNTWESRASAPLGASNKTWKNGSCLAASDDGYTIYALKGSYNEFFSYSCSTNTWTSLTTLPLIGAGGKKKKVKDGAGLAYHAGHVYAQKGGNTFEFWTYAVDSHKWVQYPDVPLGSGKKVKGGGALCASDDALYEFKGNNTFDFFKYGFSAISSQLTANSPNEMSNSSFRTPHAQLRIAPNPFTNTTTIAFTLPKPSNVSLRLYNVTGSLVTTVSQGLAGAGNHTTTLDATKLAKGIYVLKLVTENSSITEKVIIE